MVKSKNKNSSHWCGSSAPHAFLMYVTHTHSTVGEYMASQTEHVGTSKTEPYMRKTHVFFFFFFLEVSELCERKHKHTLSRKCTSRGPIFVVFIFI